MFTTSITKIFCLFKLLTLITFVATGLPSCAADTEAPRDSGASPRRFGTAALPIAATPKFVCEGDNDFTSACFAGTTLYGNAMDWLHMYSWSSFFQHGDAEVITWASGGAAWQAIWTFKPTPISGDVWLSVWVPSQNATASLVYYEARCYPAKSSYAQWTTKTISQLAYSGVYVTLGNVGTLASGSTCTVSAMKFLTNSEYYNGGTSKTKMAIDGMKLTIY